MRETSRDESRSVPSQQTLQNKGYRRGIGVGVKGVTGRDAIVPKNSWLPSTFPVFSGFRGATTAQ